jgi:UDP-N-acetylmuramate--alanine ligase
MLAEYKNRYVLFGLKDSADIYPRNIQMKGLTSEFDCFYKNKLIDRFHLALGGRHNISNALSVIALGLELGIDAEVIKKTLNNYKGAKRRLEIKFNAQGLLIIDDYAHHPTEIKATLEAVKNLNRERIIAVFQPHRYTRTKLLLDEFGLCFDLADYLILTDIYAASEPPIEGITARCICDKVRESSPFKEIHFLPKEEILTHVLGILKPGDIIIFLGAGDIAKISDELAERLNKR